MNSESTRQVCPQRLSQPLDCPEADVPLRPFDPFELRRLDDTTRQRTFPQEDANAVVAMLRSAACEVAKQDSYEFPGGAETYVAGHVGDVEESPPRFSYFVLPAIGHEHAGGMIRQMLIAEEHAGDRRQASWAADRLRGRPLVSHNKRAVALLQSLSPRERKVLPLYVGKSTIWESVTPVIPPGFDGFRSLLATEAEQGAIRGTKAQRLFLTALANCPCSGWQVILYSCRGLLKKRFWLPDRGMPP